jgi:hypothetical protein
LGNITDAGEIVFIRISGLENNTLVAGTKIELKSDLGVEEQDEKGDKDED